LDLREKKEMKSSECDTCFSPWKVRELKQAIYSGPNRASFSPFSFPPEETCKPGP